MPVVVEAAVPAVAAEVLSPGAVVAVAAAVAGVEAAPAAAAEVLSPGAVIAVAAAVAGAVAVLAVAELAVFVA